VQGIVGTVDKPSAVRSLTPEKQKWEWGVASLVQSKSVGQVEVQEWRRGWPLVLAASMGFAFYSLLAASQGIFMEPVSAEFHWGRAEFSSGTSIAAVISALLAPVYGIFLDRWGVRRLALPGLVMTALCLASFSLITGSSLQWMLVWSIFALVSTAVKSTVWTQAVAGAFIKGRGLAIGLVLSGTAFAQIISPPLTNWLITDYGWRTAFVALGLGWGAIAFLICVFWLKDYNLAADEEHVIESRSDLPGLSMREAMRDTALWRVAISTLIMMILTIALVAHQFQILVEAGVTRSHAAWLSSLSGVAGIIGKLVTGALLDRYKPNWVGGVTIASTALAFGLLLESVRTPFLIVIAMIMNGYASGTKLQIAGYLTTRYGGLRNFGKIFGMMASLIALGSGLGPYLAGLAHDKYGDYSPMLVAGIVGSIFCGLLIFSLPRYPDWDARRSADAFA
jgi:predicted MFS family arabinose efflux permease